MIYAVIAIAAFIVGYTVHDIVNAKAKEAEAHLHLVLGQLETAIHIDEAAFRSRVKTIIAAARSRL